MVLALGAGPASAQPVLWRPDARVVITDFTRVVGIAVDSWRVIAATEHGLISYDPVGRAWDPPLTVEDGYPALERPTALGWVERAGTLLLGTWTGSIWRIEVDARRIERVAQVPGSVLDIRGDEDGNAWLRTGAGWYRLAPGSFFPQAAAGAPGAASVDDVYLRAMQGQLGLDPAFRRWRVTSQAPGRLGGEYWIGTDGGGIARVDTYASSVEWLPFGLTTRGGGAVARAGDRVWFGGDDTGRQRASVASATAELQQWARPSERDAPRGRVHAIVGHAGATWFATADGLFELVEVGGAWRRFDESAGLPAPTVTALQVADDALWVGTSRGVCRFVAGHCGSALLPGRHVTALAQCRDRLWAATRGGLFTIRGDLAEAVQLPGLRARIESVACLGERVFAAGASRLLEHAGSSWVDVVVPRPQGTLHTLFASEDGLWIGADRWVGHMDATADGWSHYIVPADVPEGPIRAILPDRSFLWLVTPGGIVRLDPQNR
ncbi:MAG TPA: hypothetical protein VK939_06580 [Longimicrobiales bacterium]|nr:hypothetical protein [Longimicrobiales bacterium]